VPTIAASTVSFSHVLLLLGIIVVGMLLAGLVVIWGRHSVTAGSSTEADSVVRSWIAISLVMGLLVFCAAAFLVTEPSLRNTLFGGLIASVSGATAFYFSTKAADRARADILKAAVTMSQGPTAPTEFLAAAPPTPALVDQPYMYEFAANGLPAPEYVLAGGELPDGLKLTADGKLAGTPKTPGEYKFSIRAANLVGSFTSEEVVVTVNPAAP